MAIPTARSRKQSRRWMAPKSRKWFLAAVVAMAIIVAAYAAAAFFGTVQPTRGAGLIFGIMAATFLAACYALALRKRFKQKPMGVTFGWLQFHIYGGILFSALILMHMGFRIPSGFFSWLLFLLSAVVALSGVAGTLLQKWIPYSLAHGTQIEAIYERIPDLIGKLRGEAEALVAGTSKQFSDFFAAEVAPVLAGPQPSSTFLLDVTGGIHQRLAVFEHVLPYLSAEEKERLKDLRQILLEKNGLDAQMSLQRLLRIWTYFHVPASSILSVLVLIHIGVALYY